jgi:simple sugar transport system ATP-binding protein
VSENLVLQTYYLPPYSKGVNIQYGAIDDNARTLIGEFDIRTPGAETPVGSLSGGNQQKVIVAREFSRPIKLLVASQPTRGLDVGSIEYIHRRIIEKRDQGCAVVLVSPELDEVMQLSDRIAVMYRGKIVAVLNADEVSKEYVGLLMAGVPVEQAGKPTRTTKVEVTL